MPAEIYTHGKQQLEAPVKRSLISSLESAYRNAWYNEDYLRNFHFNGEYLRGLETCLVRITSACLNRNILLVSSLKSVTVLNRNNHVFARNIIRPPLIRVSPQIRGGSNFSRTVDRANVSRIHTSREFHAIGDTSIQKKKKIYKKKFSRVSDFSFPRFFLPNLFLSCFGKKLKHPSRLKTTFQPLSTRFPRDGENENSNRGKFIGGTRNVVASIVHSRYLVKIWRSIGGEGKERGTRESTFAAVEIYSFGARPRNAIRIRAGHTIARFIAFCLEFPFCKPYASSSPPHDPSPAKTLLPAH